MMNEKMKQTTEDKRTNYEPLAVAKNIRPLIQQLLGKKGIMQLEILMQLIHYIIFLKIFLMIINN